MRRSLMAMLGLFLGLILRVSTACADGVTEQQTAWTKQLIQQPLESYQANIALVKAHPDETFAIVRDGWNDIRQAGGKQNLFITFKAANNPHLLDLLDLGMHDDNPGVRYVAEDNLVSFSFRFFMDDDVNGAYMAWRGRIAGMKQEDVIRESAKTYFIQLDTVHDATERMNLLNVLNRVDFASQIPLSQLRRDLAKENRALDILGKGLAPPETPTVTEIYAVRMFQPDEAYLHRVILPLTAKNFPPPVRYAAIAVLASFQSPAATEILTRMLTEGTDPDGVWILRQALAASTDPRLIPVMIGVLEAEDDSRIDEMLQYPLQKLTQAYFQETHSGGWWHLWWNKNRMKFTAEVRNAPIPHLKPQLRESGQTTTYRRKIEWHEIDGDPQRAYWLVCPAYVPSPDETAGTRHRFGLVVALASDGDGDNLVPYWIDAGQKALNDQYYIAVPIAPQGARSAALPWAMEKSRAGGATLSTESFTKEIVEDVASTIALDRNRCFLHGMGESGLATYACSLTESTPFHGFYILTSGFHSAQLPALTRAKGRRYYIQNSPQDKTAPAWQAAAGGEMLSKQGAVVKLVSVDGEHGYKFEGDPWKPIHDAIGWLETNGK